MKTKCTNIFRSTVSDHLHTLDLKSFWIGEEIDLLYDDAPGSLWDKVARIETMLYLEAANNLTDALHPLHNEVVILIK